MTDLTDTQRTLLVNAATRLDRSILPLPSTMRPSGGIRKALAALISRGLAEEHPTTDPDAIYRDHEGTRLGLFMNLAGADAVGARNGSAEPQGHTDTREAAAPTAKGSKAAAVLVLLQRQDGATLAELIEATGWLPHTTRAALTGLRKKGHDVRRTKSDGATCYRIEAQI